MKVMMVPLEKLAYLNAVEKAARAYVQQELAASLYCPEEGGPFHELAKALGLSSTTAIHRAEQWTPEEMARMRMEQAINICQGCFRPVSACICK